MYQVSEYFLENLDKKYHSLRGTITIKTDEGNVETVFDENNLQSNSFSISSQCVSGSAFEIGAVCSKELNMVLILPEIKEYALMGAEIFVEFGLETDTDNEFEWVPLGKFYVTKPKKRRDYTEITACDAVGLLDMTDNAEVPVAKWLTGTHQAYDMLEIICGYAGVQIGSTREEIEALPNGTVYTYVPEDTEISSTRDILSYLAVFLGGFVTTNRDGGIIIRQHKQASQTVLKNNMIKSNTTAVSDFQMIICGLIIYLDEGQSWGKSWYPDDEGKPNSVILDVSDNPFFIGYYLLNPTETRLDNVIELLGNIAVYVRYVPWIPFECEFYSNPAIDTGDCITVENYDGSRINSVVSHYTYRFRNTQKIRCSGEDSRVLKGVRTENKRLYEVLEKKINNSKGKDVTQSELEEIIQNNRYAEGQTFFVFEE